MVLPVNLTSEDTCNHTVQPRPSQCTAAIGGWWETYNKQLSVLQLLEDGGKPKQTIKFTSDIGGWWET